jgi:hypothetical protein
VFHYECCFIENPETSEHEAKTAAIILKVGAKLSATQNNCMAWMLIRMRVASPLFYNAFVILLPVRDPGLLLLANIDSLQRQLFISWL